MYSKTCLLALLLAPACNSDEGTGGSLSIQGTLYNIIHSDEDYTFSTDTLPAEKQDVYLIYGNNPEAYFGDDTETDPQGLYRFDYLRKGNYTVYAYSEYPDGRRQAVYQSLQIGKDLNRAPHLYVHSGKAYGTAIIQGYVSATYYHNGSYRDQGEATGMRAYIRKKGAEGFFDDARVAGGVFLFRRIPPGEYEVAVESEHADTERVDLVYAAPLRITETGIIYLISEIFHVYVSV
ncbi:MAG: hypothetical protein LBD89_01930 [Tannerellaceae bacterium]|jgi:hypothetical protein|nr:hypothetical protein [Tannerellaceae bacterium]